MRLRTAIVLAVVITGVVRWTPLRGLTTLQAPQPQTFRTGTDAVVVDVSVRDGNRAVTGLRADDFVVTDNGVRQRLESVEAAAVPIDVTLVVDVSGNSRGAWEARRSTAHAADVIRRETSNVRALLRPEDRIRVLAVDTHVQQVVSLQNASAALPALTVEAGGLSSLYEALVAALLQPVQPARRHVVIASTKGLDTVSSINAAAVRAVAEQSDALFHVVLQQTANDNEAALSAWQCAVIGLCWPSRSFWVPHDWRMMTRLGEGTLLGALPAPYRLLPDGEAIASGAEATGGALHRTQLVAEPTLASTFRKAFEDFRSSYVLRYTLQGVAQGGWHTIDVSVPGKRNYTVRGRKGYLVETTEPPPSLPALPAQLRSVADFTTAYERGAFRQVASSLRQLANPADLLRDFQEAGNPWPGNPRREAALILELAEPGLFASRRETRQAAVEAMDRFSRLIRHPLEPDLFERYWHFALLTTLEGTLRPALTEIYVERALARFPDEPRFVLSRAIASDQQSIARGAGTTALDATTPTGEQQARVRERYEAAIALPATAVEARIRFAWFLHRIGQFEEAAQHLRTAAQQPIQDTSLRYLQLLFSGYTSWALNRQDEAIAHYRSAMQTLPAAQSARVALMNALVLRGDPAEAEGLAQHVQTEVSTDMDPWWMYWQGQYRLQPQAMARVRELSR